jgi:hypothetical protein
MTFITYYLRDFEFLSSFLSRRDYGVNLTESVLVNYIDKISHKELNNQISELLKNYTVVTEKYKVRIFMYPSLYVRWN